VTGDWRDRWSREVSSTRPVPAAQASDGILRRMQYSIRLDRRTPRSHGPVGLESQATLWRALLVAG